MKEETKNTLWSLFIGAVILILIIVMVVIILNQLSFLYDPTGELNNCANCTI